MLAVGFIYAFGMIVKYWPIFAIVTLVLLVAYGSDALSKRRVRAVHRSQAYYSNRR